MALTANKLTSTLLALSALALMVEGCGPAVLVAAGVGAGVGSSGGGDGGSAGGGPAPGAPLLSISPVVDAPWGLTDRSFLTVRGAASDDQAVTRVTWRNSSTGASGIASGTTSWWANVSLRVGPNTVVITAHDAQGNTSEGSLTFVRSITVVEDFEPVGSAAPRLGFRWSSTSLGRTRVTQFYSPHGGAYHLTMDAEGSRALQNEATLTVNLGAHTTARLTFWHKGFNDELHALPAIWTGGATGDGVAISADGKVWHRVTTLNGPSTWTQYVVDLGAHAASAGIALGDGFRIRFQQYGNGSIPSDGFAFDDIVVTAP